MQPASRQGDAPPSDGPWDDCFTVSTAALRSVVQWAESRCRRLVRTGWSTRSQSAPSVLSRSPDHRMPSISVAPIPPLRGTARAYDDAEVEASV